MLSQGEGCREGVAGGGWKQTRQRYDKSPTSKIYTTWARILSDRDVFFITRGERTTAGLMRLRLFCYPAGRTGSSNTRFFTPPSGRGLVIPVFLPRHQDGV